jgi:MarR family transcriptional regulator, transcriptional regulator for hemolysin
LPVAADYGCSAHLELRYEPMPTNDLAHLMRDLTRDLLLAGRLWRKMARAAAAKHGVSEAASAPLIWIDRLGENVRQNALADAIGIEGASLVRLIDELQASGLVTREPDPTDRRANAVSLTDRGRKVVAEVNEDVMALRRQVFAGLDQSDFEATLRVFAAIKAAAKDEQ